MNRFKMFPPIPLITKMPKSRHEKKAEMSNHIKIDVWTNLAILDDL